MKKLILALTITVVAFSVKAQDKTTSPAKKTSFEIGANIGTGLSDGTKLGVGADLQADINMGNSLKFTLSGGYENVSYKAKNISGVVYPEGNTNFIPVLAGLKYYFSPKVYGHGQAGYSFSTTKNGGGAFSFAPSLGFLVGNNFDIAVKYVNIGKSNGQKFYGGSIGLAELRLAYNF